MDSLMRETYRNFSTINYVDAIRGNKTFPNPAKLVHWALCGAVLILNCSLAEAQSLTNEISLSARVVRGCGISPTTLDSRDSHARGDPKKIATTVSNGVIINCHPDSLGTMALSVGSNMAGSAVIRVMSSEELKSETLKDISFTHDGTNSEARYTNLGLFPAAGQKMIVIQDDNLGGSQLRTHAGEKTITLFINF